MPTLPGETPPILRYVVYRFSETREFSKLDCGHVMDHGPTMRAGAQFPAVGQRVGCRQCKHARRKQTRRQGAA